MTASQAASAIAAGLSRARPDLVVRRLPIADGGDGTVEALEAVGFRPVRRRVAGPTGGALTASFARRGTTAVIELAEASGLRRLAAGGREPLRASSLGTGQLLVAALDAGCRTLVLGLGGSACTDGGAGLLTALGARLLDARGAVLPPGGAALRSIVTVDLSPLDRRLQDVEVVCACDVDNPLLGPSGAAAAYAPQKGASEADVTVLEHGLAAWAGAVAAAIGRDVSSAPGAGAAGGVGFAALATLGARLQPGADLVLRLLRFERALSGARLLVTGEGSLDEQTLRGKAPARAAALAVSHGVRTVAVVGTSELSRARAAAAGFDRVFCLTDLEPCLAESRRNASRLLEELAASEVASACLAG